MPLNFLKLITKLKKYCLDINDSEKEFLTLNRSIKEKINNKIWIDIKKLQDIKKTNISSR